MSEPSLPPGPRLPRALQALRFAAAPAPFLESCARRYGHTFTLRFPLGMDFVITSDPVLIREVFSGDPKLFDSSQLAYYLKPFLRDQSIFLLSGERHHEERRKLMPLFQSERMARYGALMAEIVSSHVRSWPLGRRIPLYEALRAAILDVILAATFGPADRPSRLRLRPLLLSMLDLTSNPLSLFFIDRRGEVVLPVAHRALGRFSPWTRIVRLRAEFDAILAEEVALRRAEPGPDILSALMGALSGSALRDEVLTLIVAGHESTAPAIAWVFHHLLSDPQALARVQAELDEAGAEQGLTKPAGDMDALPYLDAAITESMRLNPVFTFVGRGLQVPMRVGGLDLPAGVFVSPCIYLSHRRADRWPEPERFSPERFLDGAAAPFEYFPFGGGSRRCLGMAFALLEMKVVVAQTLSCLTLEPMKGYRARAVRRGISFVPSLGLPVYASKREAHRASSARSPGSSPLGSKR